MVLTPSESMSVISAGSRDAIAFPRGIYKVKRMVSVPDLAQSVKTRKLNYWLTPRSQTQTRSTSGYGTYKNLWDTYWYDRRYYSEWPNYYYSSRPQYRKGTYEYPYSTWWYTAGPLSYPSVVSRNQQVDYLDPIYTSSYGSSRPWWRPKRPSVLGLSRAGDAIYNHTRGLKPVENLDHFWLNPTANETRLWANSYSKYPHFFY